MPKRARTMPSDDTGDVSMGEAEGRGGAVRCGGGDAAVGDRAQSTAGGMSTAAMTSSLPPVLKVIAPPPPFQSTLATGSTPPSTVPR